jgi:glucokinase
MNTIALDLGGTRLKIGIVNKGNILGTVLLDSFSNDGLSPRLPFIEQAIEKLLKDKDIQHDSIRGIGISVPGIVDSKEMKILSINKKFFDVTEIDFKKWAFDKWGLPVFIENDARAALIGEWQFGAGAGYDNLVMVTLGTGVGGAAIIEGSLLRGKHFVAGCLAGHFTINFNGNKCNCGNIGCVESEASSWSIAEIARDNALYTQSPLSKVELLDYEQVFSYAKESDQLAEILVAHSLKAWSSGVVNLIHAYDPEKVIIGGGIMKSSEAILPFVRKYVSNHAWTPWGNVEIVCAQNPDWAGIQGVEYLFNQFYKTK